MPTCSINSRVASEFSLTLQSDAPSPAELIHGRKLRNQLSD